MKNTIRPLALSFASAALFFLMVSSGSAATFKQKMFGLESDVIHPFLTISGEYNDNLFTDETNEKDDFFTRVTPGVWFAFPGTDAEVVNIASSSSAPAGQAQTRFQGGQTGRVQSFFKYAPTFEKYADIDDLDITTHQLDAYTALNFRGGLSFEIFDQYNDNRDRAEEETGRAEYNNNLLGLTTSYAVSSKTKVRLDVSYFDVNYDSRKAEKDRNDMAVSGFFFFDIMPRTSLFAEASHVDIDYDNPPKFDSTETKYFLGVKYEASARIDAMLKVGYMDKDVDTKGSESTMAFEGGLTYSATDRITLMASGGRANKESVIGDFVTETMARLTGFYVFSQRVDAMLMGYWSDEAYSGRDRDDLTWEISPSIRYNFSPKCSASLTWAWTDRDASGSEAGTGDYTQTRTTLMVTGTF